MKVFGGKLRHELFHHGIAVVRHRGGGRLLPGLRHGLLQKLMQLRDGAGFCPVGSPRPLDERFGSHAVFQEFVKRERPQLFAVDAEIEVGLFVGRLHEIKNYKSY